MLNMIMSEIWKKYDLKNWKFEWYFLSAELNEESTIIYFCSDIFYNLDDVSMMRSLINEGFNINTKLVNGKTLLHWAAENGNCWNSFFQTQAIVWFCSSCNPGNIAFVKFLIEHGADVNATNNNGESALYLAAGLGIYLISYSIKSTSHFLILFYLEFREYWSC